MSKWSSAYRDSRWQRKRLAVMERDNWRCVSCGASGEGVLLNVHHGFYVPGRAPWEYQDEDLVTWCEDCHNIRHTETSNITNAFSMLTAVEFEAVAKLLRWLWIDPTFKGDGILEALNLQLARWGKGQKAASTKEQETP